MAGIECFAAEQAGKYCHSADGNIDNDGTSNSLQEIVNACLADADCECVVEQADADPRFSAKKASVIFPASGYTSWSRTDFTAPTCDTGA